MTNCSNTGVPVRFCTCVACQKPAGATDLLGDPVPTLPPMNAPLPWCVFQMNYYDWWVARTRSEAMDSYEEATGEREEDCEEVSEEALDRLKFTDADEDEKPTGVVRTFREELARRVAAGLSDPEIFASTEY